MNEPADIFAWANNIDALKNELDVELFFVNKNYTPYSVRRNADLEASIKQLFLYDLISYVNMGAATGLSVRPIEKADKNENVLAHVDLGVVGRAETVLYLIENERNDIVEFSQEEHEFKRLKAIVARYTHPEKKDLSFYVIKEMPATKAVCGSTAWQFNGGELSMQKPEVTVKMPADNQVLVIGTDIFAFSQSKFKNIFGFDARQIALVNEKGAAIDKHFKLSFPDLIQEISFACIRSSTRSKLLKVDTDNLMSQEQVIDTVDELGIQLMTDDNGAIILMEDSDVSVFLDVINDNYVQGMTGAHYLAKNKKPIMEDKANGQKR